MSHSVLGQFDLFSLIPEKDLRRIYKSCIKLWHHKGEVILVEQDTGVTFFLIVRGKVKISRVTPDGREVILSIISAGDFFGEMSIIDGESRSANVSSLDDTEVLAIRGDDFMKLLYKFPQMSINLLKELTSRLRRSDQQIKALSLRDAVGKFASTLLRIAEKTGVSKSGKVVLKNIPSQQNLASMSGTSRETVSRAIKSLTTDGYLERTGNTITIYNYERFQLVFT